MAGGHMKYRHLSRSSSHRQALLRNLVTSLFRHESIATTWHKAKEAQRLAEKLVTLGKKNTEASRRRAQQIFYDPNEMVPKLFGPIRERYASRPGGYTRVLRIEPMKEDQADSALLEFVDGPKDMRFAMTAKILAKMHPNREPTKVQARKVEQVTKFRDDGVNELRDMIDLMRIEQREGMDKRRLAAPRTVYPTERIRREMHYKEEVKFYKHPNKLPKGLKQRRLGAKKAGEKAVVVEKGESDLVVKQVESDEPAKQTV